jgi:hypothetical protein
VWRVLYFLQYFCCPVWEDPSTIIQLKELSGNMRERRREGGREKRVPASIFYEESVKRGVGAFVLSYTSIQTGVINAEVSSKSLQN